ncbi:unnamed protein product [Hyaloperonospora brassicae]|uniref:RxLR effector candidate protein n=1 Tax=Hyaloperonospora brassicae TaxID=162125 RepID=A0AAV0TLG6_HYABA|nr:unnamed protein product [Hyaloperonospora brassicae]
MRHGQWLALLLAAALAALAAADTVATEPKEVAIDVDGDLPVQDEAEVLEAADAVDETAAAPEPKVDPRLTLEAMEKLFAKMSARCRQQLQENAPDAPEVSDRCRREAAGRIQRYLARLDREERGETTAEEGATKADAKPQQKSRKGKKRTRAQRKAAAAQKKEDEYQKTLQIIVGFVVTFVAVIAGAMFVINRKLKAAGLYFADPTAKASCCCD